MTDDTINSRSMMTTHEIAAFVSYVLLILLPFTVFAVVVWESNHSCHNNDENCFNDRNSNEILRRICYCWMKRNRKEQPPHCYSPPSSPSSLSLTLSLYVTNFPLVICVYHCLLTAALTLFCLNTAMLHLNVAVDLSYYTKTTIRAAEVLFRERALMS
jgi:hypothetical protein